MKKIIALLFVLIMVLTSVEALAARTADGTYYDTVSLNGLPAFKFQHQKKGIGLGVCTVYSAPYRDAYISGNGKAKVDTNSYIDIAGYNSDGWLLVRYETNGGNWRVGWLAPEDARKKGFKTNMEFHFGRIPQVAEETIDVTENNKTPYSRNSVIGQIEEGDTYYVLGFYNYYKVDLWYVEFDNEGETACGFIYR